jgi:glucose-1-phosphate thymidylyltransferase
MVKELDRFGLILAGGLGTRLFPSTRVVSKQLLPVFDKPMIYYPLTTLMLSGIKNILIITSPEDKDLFQNLLEDGSQWGINIQYAIQESPDGLAQAFLIGEQYINNRKSALILGDNIFYGHNLASNLVECSKNNGATIFTYRVNDPENYGIANLNDAGKIISVEEKPKNASSNLAITGLYFYDESVVDRVKNQKPSPRGELEITDVNASYLADNMLNMHQFQRGYIWMDTGTHENLFDASQFVALIEKRQGLKVACPEEIALNNGWIDEENVLKICSTYKDNSYKKYLLSLIS